MPKSNISLKCLGVDGTAARREFLSYCLSLMRAHNSEHLDSLPVLDVSALKHVAYVFDALIYFMRSGSHDVQEEVREVANWNEADENENEEGEEEIPVGVAMETESLDVQEVANLAAFDSTINSSTNLLGNSSGKGRKHSFFQRSESTLCLGCPPPDPFESPMSEALPLADQPHLLQPNARREDLFGIPKQPICLSSKSLNSTNPANPLETLPERLSLSSRTSNFAMREPAKAHHPISESFNVMGPHPITYPNSNQDGATAASTSGSSTNLSTSPNEHDSKKKDEASGQDRPQDLSCNKEQATAPTMPMETDSDSEEDKEEKKAKLNKEQTSTSSRPQIIVSPRKTSSGEDTKDKEESASTSRSPGKSVIVRAGAGPTVSLINDFIYQIWEMIHVYMLKKSLNITKFPHKKSLSDDRIS